MIAGFSAVASRSLPVLGERFSSLDSYQSARSRPYTLLPFRFIRLDAERYVATNVVGEHIILSAQDLQDFIRHKLPAYSNRYNELKSRHFLLDDESNVALDLLAVKLRTKHSFLSNFTSLFMFVTTLRCDHSCGYCQVSRQSQDKIAFDMTEAMADRAIDFLFRTPSPSVKVEFQGGEPLLNFDLIRYIVEEVKQRNAVANKEVVFVIATNLAPVRDEHLSFCGEHGVFISTSLDGPRELHNRNRPRPGRDSYERAIEGIQRVRAALGRDKVAALMTTTEASLRQPVEIIDEYVRQDFNSIFLRSISPYGFAARSGLADRYRMSDWLDFYKKGLAHIIELNHRGIRFREEYAAIILQKMLTPWATGYVDLQSPAGMGLSCLVFNYDGDIYASDESRMLAEMGDKTFRLGNVFTDSFEDVMLSPALLTPLKESMTDGVPMCSDCGFQPYCGSDPVYHHATDGDFVGFKPTSDFCRKNMAIMRHLVTLLEDDLEAAAVLRSWV